MPETCTTRHTVMAETLSEGSSLPQGSLQTPDTDMLVLNDALLQKLSRLQYNVWSTLVKPVLQVH